MKRIIIYCITILICTACTKNNGELILIDANPHKGFNYPYYLFIPNGTASNSELFIIIEPNNSGFADDNFQKHLEKAKRTASKDFYIGNYIAQKFKYPLIVPVFPRPRTQWKIYTHSLDRDVVLQKDSLRRVDLQLLEMFNDARAKLKEKQIMAKEQFLLTGFSASGTFANRFTLIHPGKVFAVAAGGINGLLMLPTDSISNEILSYPLGTNDFKKLFNKDFQPEVFSQTPQFYFMGENDSNDAIPYEDGYSDGERELVYKLMGKEMQPKRWAFCQDYYTRHGVNAKLKTYKDTGHEHPENVKKDILQFFKAAIKSNHLRKME